MTHAGTKDDPSDKTLLCLFAHPDDESYSVAGTIALCAKNNTQVTIAYCTRGEAGPDFLQDRHEDLNLSDIRTKEAERACRTLGINPPVFLDLPDGKLSSTESSRAMAKISDIIKSIKPDMLLSSGPDGAYGHLDHITCYRWIDRLMAETPIDKRPVCMWSVFPKGAFSGFYKKIKSSYAGAFLADLDGNELGVDRDKIDLHVDVSGVLDIKKQVIACHKSQLPTGKIQSFPLFSALKPFLHTEMFVCAYGPCPRHGACSPMEGL